MGGVGWGWVSEWVGWGGVGWGWVSGGGGGVCGKTRCLHEMLCISYCG